MALGAGPVAAAARFQSGKATSKAVIDTDGFRFVDLESWRDPQFLPGAVRYGDLPGLLALNAPEALRILGEGDKIPSLTGDIYKIRGKAGSVATRPSRRTQVAGVAPGSGKDLFDNPARTLGDQLALAAIVLVNQPVGIESQQVKERGVIVVRVYDILHINIRRTRGATGAATERVSAFDSIRGGERWAR